LILNIQFNVSNDPDQSNKVSNLNLKNVLVNEKEVDYQAGQFKAMGFIVSGQITYIADSTKPVSNTELDIYNTDNEICDTAFSNADGWYTFIGLAQGEYIIKPSKNDELFGLGSTDAAYISLYNVDNEEATTFGKFDCKKKLTADVNLSRFIGALDVSAIYMYDKKKCLNEKCLDWVFIPELITSCEDWENGYIEDIEYSSQRSLSLNSNRFSEHFIASRLGDVSEDWHIKQSPPIQARSMKPVKVTAFIGNKFTLPVEIKDESIIIGIDMKIKYNPTVLSINEDDISLSGGFLEYKDYALISNLDEKGYIRLAVPATMSIVNNGVGKFLFLKFKPVSSANSSTMVTIEEFKLNDKYIINGGFYLDGVTSQNARVVIE